MINVARKPVSTSKEHLNSINRERVIEFLYKVDLLGIDDIQCRKDFEGWPKSYAYAITVLDNYLKNSKEIDDLIQDNLIEWKLTRLPFMDRAILRAGFSELLLKAVPDGVILSEAVKLANEYSGVESQSFVNGVLAKFVKKFKD